MFDWSYWCHANRPTWMCLVDLVIVLLGIGLPLGIFVYSLWLAIRG